MLSMVEISKGSFLWTLVRKVYRWLPKSPSTNYLYRIPTNPFELLDDGATILDIGSSSLRSDYLWGKPKPNSKLICLDIEPSPGVDVVADAHDMSPIADSSMDCVVTVSTFEYFHHPARVVAEIERVLKPGGIVYVSVPFTFPLHPEPTDYFRYSKDGIALLFEDFELVENGFNRGPASTMLELNVRFWAMLLSFNSRTLYSVNCEIFKWLFFWFKYLDVFLAKFKMAEVIHSGAFFLGRKVENSNDPRTDG